MTEEEWRTGWDCQAIHAQCVRPRLDNRRCRLVVVACCRLLTHAFFDPRIGQALSLAEEAADDDATEAILDHIWRDGLYALPAVGRTRFEPRTGWEASVFEAVLATESLYRQVYPGMAYGARITFRNWKQLLVKAAQLGTDRDPIQADEGRAVAVVGLGDCAEVAMRCIEIAYLLHDRDVVVCYGDEVEPEIRRPMADHLRDIFGNPFRPVAFDPKWRTEHAVGIAARMYDERDFAAMSILADALEEAGCDNADILTHCREPGVHVRGCWVVDLVMGK